MSTLLVVGAAVLDCVYVMDELPVTAEKYKAKNFALRGGGTAATAAVTAKRLGLDVALAARVGDDVFGAAIVDELEREGVDCKLVRRHPGKQSSVSAVMIDRSGERMLVNFKDPGIDSGTSWLPQKLPPEIAGILGDHHWAAGTGALFSPRPRGWEGCDPRCGSSNLNANPGKRDPYRVLGAGLARTVRRGEPAGSVGLVPSSDARVARRNRRG